MVMMCSAPKTTFTDCCCKRKKCLIVLTNLSLAVILTFIRICSLLQISTSCQTLDFTAQSVIQAEDLSIVKYYFDTCVSTCESEASDETKAEYEAMMQDQNNLQSLKNLGSDVMDWVVRIVNWSEKDMLKN
ncbi:hypothetical protein BDF20DRAFT_981742 [Mycotypha africana]|uniref:uncharacterized protein n=1 Tax=Mycotypha africana TaxID=64632 RepID=UPI0023013D90|nr:uncharacterized protein BDF20DRAFT_981742 [Mycotypha africana]KAI8968523.1 hypothetical protein BDF20DRAFT_981742 [Mycotypha africana]